MFDTLSDEAGTLARSAAVRVCWAQWVSMGSLASPVEQRRPRALIDPEALILLSLYVGEDERRLMDLVAWWAQVGSHLTSVQRLRSVAKRFPDQTGADAMGVFASLAAQAGDRRWTRHANQSIPESVRHGKGPKEPSLIQPSTLWPRLRAGFGVGAKADALVFLLGLRGAWASVRVISLATGYSSVAVRKAVGEMTLARLIRETDGRPAEYLAPAGPWGVLLELFQIDGQPSTQPEVPGWRFWSEIFAFLASVAEWSRHVQLAPARSPHTVASEARDIVKRHTRAFDLNGISTPPMNAFKGPEAVHGLVETTRIVTDWMESNV